MPRPVKEKRLELRLGADLYEQVRRLAKRRGWSVSKTVRLAVVDLLDRDGEAE